MRELLKQSKKHEFVFRLSATAAVMAVVSGLWQPSQAMHIAEGFLPTMWAGLWYIIALPFVVMGFKKLQKVTQDHPKAKILLAMAGAFTFILSALKIPSLTGSCSHPTGIALGAILFGPGPMAIIGLIVLLFQAILLAHGGITTLGANLFSMAIVGAWVAYLCFKALRKAGVSPAIAVFFAAFLGDLLTYVVTATQLAVAFPGAEGGIMESLIKFFGIFAVTQVPIAISEGVLSVIIFQVIASYSTEQVVELESALGYGTANDLKKSYTQGTQVLFKKIVMLVLVTAVLFVAPLYIVKEAEFGGADGEAEVVIEEIAPDYEPIFEPLIEPASGEIESMLFALQAAIGAGIIGFGLGKITRNKSGHDHL